MSMMRTHRLTTYLQAEEACTLIEFLDQMRDMLLEAYCNFPPSHRPKQPA